MVRVEFKKISGEMDFIHIDTSNNFTINKLIGKIAGELGVKNIDINYMDGGTYVPNIQLDIFNLADRIKTVIKTELKLVPIILRIAKVDVENGINGKVLTMGPDVSKLTLEVTPYKNIKRLTVRAGNYIHNVPAISDRPFKVEDVGYANCSLTIVNDTVAFVTDTNKIQKFSNIKLNNPIVVNDMNNANDDDVCVLEELIEFFNVQFEFYKGEMK